MSYSLLLALQILVNYGNFLNLSWIGGGLKVNISIMVMCYAIAVILYDRRRPELSNAPLHMK